MNNRALHAFIQDAKDAKPPKDNHLITAALRQLRKAGIVLKRGVCDGVRIVGNTIQVYKGDKIVHRIPMTHDDTSRTN